MKYKYLVRLIFTRLLTAYLFTKYVKDNELLKKDILNNAFVKRKNKNASIQKHFFQLLTHNSEFSYMFFWRINSSSFFWKWFFYRDYSCKIYRSSNIGGGVVCYHPYATIINAKTIGENFVFRNGLTIGNKNDDNSLIPVIGDNVEVGANVVIIGNITIGNNVVIGAGSVVVKDVPDNVVVAGNPAKVIRNLNEVKHCYL